MISVLYEDESLLFVDKPAGIVVQRGYDATEPVLFEQVQEYAGSRGESAYLMQRLDRGTSGVIFFSKLAEVNANLTRQFERKLMRKSYVALCEGRLAQPQLIDAPLARIGPISFGVRSSGKRALTRIERAAAGTTATALRIRLLTGRTHQIRAHLAAIGHPLVGDWLYGERNDERPMLHARSLTLRHPKTGEWLSVEAPLPADFLKSAEARGVDRPGIERLLSHEGDEVTPGEVE